MIFNYFSLNLKKMLYFYFLHHIKIWCIITYIRNDSSFIFNRRRVLSTLPGAVATGTRRQKSHIHNQHTRPSIHHVITSVVGDKNTWPHMFDSYYFECRDGYHCRSITSCRDQCQTEVKPGAVAGCEYTGASWKKRGLQGARRFRVACKCGVELHMAFSQVVLQVRYLSYTQTIYSRIYISM